MSGPPGLHFVDPRKLARWRDVVAGPDAPWQAERGPDPVAEYEAFAARVAAAAGAAPSSPSSPGATESSRVPRLTDNSTVAEALLDQRLFNGVGNYLRAEVLYRCRMSPFKPAASTLRDATLRGLMLRTVRQVIEESINLGNKYENETGRIGKKTAAASKASAKVSFKVPSAGKKRATAAPGSPTLVREATRDEDMPAGGTVFSRWLRVYGKGPGQAKDRGGRTVWYDPAVQGVKRPPLAKKKKPSTQQKKPSTQQKKPAKRPPATRTKKSTVKAKK